MKKSRFGNIVSRSKGQLIADDEPETPEVDAVADDQATTEPASQPTATTADATSGADAPKLGRPKTGKRSLPGFRSVSLWLKAETFADADALLTRQRRLNRIAPGAPRDVSELAESLIADWLKKQPNE